MSLDSHIFLLPAHSTLPPSPSRSPWETTTSYCCLSLANTNESTIKCSVKSRMCVTRGAERPLKDMWDPERRFGEGVRTETDPESDLWKAAVEGLTDRRIGGLQHCCATQADLSLQRSVSDHTKTARVSHALSSTLFLSVKFDSWLDLLKYISCFSTLIMFEWPEYVELLEKWIKNDKIKPVYILNLTVFCQNNGHSVLHYTIFTH